MENFDDFYYSNKSVLRSIALKVWNKLPSTVQNFDKAVDFDDYFQRCLISLCKADIKSDSETSLGYWKTTCITKIIDLVRKNKRQHEKDLELFDAVKLSNPAIYPIVDLEDSNDKDFKNLLKENYFTLLRKQPVDDSLSCKIEEALNSLKSQNKTLYDTLISYLDNEFYSTPSDLNPTTKKVRVFRAKKLLRDCYEIQEKLVYSK